MWPFKRKRAKHRYQGTVEASVTTEVVAPEPAPQVQVVAPWEPILGETVYIGGGTRAWQVRALGPQFATVRCYDSLGRSQVRTVAISRLRAQSAGDPH